MAEPVGLIASIVSIVQGAGLLASTIDNIRNAPESVKAIKNDLGLLMPALKKLKSVIDERGPDFADLGPEIQSTLQHCQEACNEFKSSLDHWTRHSTSEGSSLLDMVKTGLLKQSRIKIMKDQVYQCIRILEVTLTTITT
ncbi:hypothetical protein IL306_015032 [Fusarium sp. DS 682]|nr:hypothetical protein IL306_015032 [Fusarium sp. DS 682]